MKNWVRNTLVLGLVCLGSAIGVGGTYLLTIPRIRARDAAREKAALKKVMPGSTDVKLVEGTEGVFAGYDGSRLVGYAAIGTAQGYSSRLRVAVGARPCEDGKLEVLAIKVIYQQETPGLGARVEEVKSDRTIWTVLFGHEKTSSEPLEPWFQEQFKHKKQDQIKLKKTGGSIDAITGATITSRAVIKAVQQALGRIGKAVKTRTKMG